jgi:predicted Fe-Mo cluster-binding NifX family protein
MNKKACIVGILVLLVAGILPIIGSQKKPSLKIAVACDGKTLDAQVAYKGARGQYLQFFDEKGQLLELHKNPFWKQPRRAGINCADFLAEKKATVFVARIVGNKMEGALDGKQITFMAFEGTVKEAVAFVLTNRKKMGTGK